MHDNLDSIWENLADGDFAGDYESAWAGVEDSAIDAPYRFAPSNPHIGEPELRERGTAHFQAGELTRAILLLEAAVQSSPDDTLAWQMLGQVTLILLNRHPHPHPHPHHHHHSDLP